MAQRIEWRFTDGSVLGSGHWFVDWGDPISERRITLTELIHVSDNPVWCLREHTNIMKQIVDAADDVIADIVGVVDDYGQPAMLVASSPMELAARRTASALQHSLALLVDALVECRKGPMRDALDRDFAFASDVAFVMSDALNCTWRIAQQLPA